MWLSAEKRWTKVEREYSNYHFEKTILELIVRAGANQVILGCQNLSS